MRPVFVFDSFKTILKCDAWDQKVEADPRLRQLQQAWIDAGRPLSHPFLDEGEGAIERGEVRAEAYPETRHVLEKISTIGAIAAYSSNSEGALNAMLRQAGLIDIFHDEGLIIPASRLNGLPKEDPAAFVALDHYLRDRSLLMMAYADDILDIVRAAIKSNTPSISGIYHVDRKSGLLSAEAKPGYLRIGRLDQMLELH